jgi:hypothetical protein
VTTVDFSGPCWRKSSRSGGEENSECVEVALAGDVTALRDSKNPVAAFAVPVANWHVFLSAAKRNDFVDS